MVNIYSDMGRFLQESFSIDDTFKKLSAKKLNESLQESFDNQVTLPEVLGWLSEHETAYEDCKRHFGMDFDDPDFDEEITVHDLEEWISEHEGLWADYLNHFNITDPYLDESLKEDFSDARPAATKIFNFIEMGVDPAAILDELLRFLPDGALVDFADYYGENFLGIGDDWDLDESLKESLNEEFEISVRSRFTPQKLKVLVNKAINDSGFPIEDIDKIEWLPGKLFETKDVIYILLKDNTEIPIVLPENNIENSIITALHRVLKYDKRYAK